MLHEFPGKANIFRCRWPSCPIAEVRLSVSAYVYLRIMHMRRIDSLPRRLFEVRCPAKVDVHLAATSRSSGYRVSTSKGGDLVRHLCDRLSCSPSDDIIRDSGYIVRHRSSSPGLARCFRCLDQLRSFGGDLEQTYTRRSESRPLEHRLPQSLSEGPVRHRVENQLLFKPMLFFDVIISITSAKHIICKSRDNEPHIVNNLLSQGIIDLIGIKPIELPLPPGS